MEAQISGRFAFRKTQEKGLEFKGDPCYETRRESVESLIKSADQIISIPNREEWIWIWSNDRPEASPFSTDLFFATYDPASPAADKKQNQIMVPDFVFADWPQVGIHDFDTLCKEVYAKGQEPALYEKKCGWYGNVSLSQVRSKLVQIAKQQPEWFDVVDTGRWKRPEPGQSIKTLLQVSKNQFKSLPELVADYGMLIDIEGYGWSGRLKLLFHSNRPLLIQERPWNEYYFSVLKPFVHYIPVKRNLSNLLEQVQWVQQNPVKAQRIAWRAAEFARFHLTRHAANQRWALQLAAYPIPLDQLFLFEKNHPVIKWIRMQMLYRLVSFLIVFYSFASLVSS